MIRKYYIDDDASGGGGGGNPAAPTAPKGYAVTTPQQRTEWNGFLDYLDKQGVADKSDLDAPGAGLKYLQQYKKANPNVSLTPEHVQNIQYEQYQLRKGDQFGSLNKMQLDHIRSGLAPAYLNRPVSDVNGQINAATSKLYYPSGKSYGTDLEHYDTGLGQSPPVTPAAQPAAAVAPANASAPAAAPDPLAAPVNAQTSSPVQPAANGQPAIYANHDTALKRAHTLATQPGNEFLHGRADTLIHSGFVPSTDTDSFKDSSIAAAKPLGIDPALLYASTMEEGMTGLVPDKQGNITTGEQATDQYPVDGFFNFGLDNFSDNFKEMVKRGYLPKDFDYQKATAKNEMGSTVHSANFSTVADALKAKAAYVKMEQDNLEDWTKKQGGVSLSPKAKQFFTLIAFNGGPGRAHVLINYYKKKGLLDGDKFLQQAPEKSADPGGAYGHVLPRLQMADLLKKEKLFD